MFEITIDHTDFTAQHRCPLAGALKVNMPKYYMHISCPQHWDLQVFIISHTHFTISQHKHQLS